MPGPELPAHDADVARAVLEEVARLSPAYRSAVVLCELEGRSRTAAARELGVPEGTLSSRLAARKVLAARLQDRGLAPAVLAVVAGAAACPVLAADAGRLAMSSDSLSPQVEKLTEAVVRHSFVMKWMWIPVAAAVATVALLVTAAEPPKPDAPQRPVVKPGDPPPAGRLLLIRPDGFTVLAPDGKEVGAVATRGGENELFGRGWLSPDGRRVAYIVATGHPADKDTRTQVVVREAGGGPFATTVDVPAWDLCWDRDGTSLVATAFDPGAAAAGTLKFEHRRLDLTGRTTTPVAWPDDVRPLEWSRDGGRVLVARAGPNKTDARFGLMTPDGKAVTDLTVTREGVMDAHARLSPDGTGARLLFSDRPASAKGNQAYMTRRLYVYDVATRKTSEVAGVPLNATVFWCCWSPDGNRIAYTWRQRHEALAKKDEVLWADDLKVETETFLIVAAADGSNPRTVRSAKSGSAIDLPFLMVDWR